MVVSKFYNIFRFFGILSKRLHIPILEIQRIDFKVLAEYQGLLGKCVIIYKDLSNLSN